MFLGGCGEIARAQPGRARRSGGRPASGVGAEAAATAVTSARAIELRDSAPPPLPPIPPPRPGPSTLVWSGQASARQLALTLDDGYCGPCISGYVDFAKRTGIHLTLNPNGAYSHLWSEDVVSTVRDLLARGQLQIGNHTWSHFDVIKLSDRAVRNELDRNEEWIQTVFGVTSRPYWRPPYGSQNQRVRDLAASLGYTKTLMWNGTLGDSTVETPAEILALAEKWVQPGTVMLGHLNHTAVLSVFDEIASLIASRDLTAATLDEMFGTSRATG